MKAGQAGLPLNTMRHVNRPVILFIFLILASGMACVIPSLSGTPTPPPPPTPEGDTIFFQAPFARSIEPDTTIPGTQIHYLRSAGDLHELTIDGLQAYRQIGDSLNWRGIVAPGVFGDYRLRLKTSFLGEVQAEGQASIAVLNPAPVEIPPTQTPVASIYLSGIPVQYYVPEGYRVPGTTLIFEGQRNQLAELSGTASYPFFALEDSLLWLGKLRSNVYIRYNVRVSTLSSDGMGLTGTAEVWITD